MKKYLLILSSFFLSHSFLHAQYLKVPVGKQFKVMVETNNITDITMMDQHMQMINDLMNQSTIEIKAITTNGFTVEITPKRMKMYLSMMGNEQNFDSDSVVDSTNPIVQNALEFINKPQTIVMENGKITFRTKLADVNSMYNNADDANKFFLTIKPNNYKQGYQWADSTIENGLKLVNQYTVMHVSKTELEVNAMMNLWLENTSKQTSIDIKQKIKGFGTAKRRYDLSTGLLINEISSIDMNGTTETNEMSAPIIIKLTCKTTVQ